MENEEKLTMDASVCMEIAGIESIVDDMDAPTVASMCGQQEESD